MLSEIESDRERQILHINYTWNLRVRVRVRVKKYNKLVNITKKDKDLPIQRTSGYPG